MSQLSLKLKKLYEEKKYKEIINIISELDDINLNSGLLNLLGVCKMQYNNSAGNEISSLNALPIFLKVLTGGR